MDAVTAAPTNTTYEEFEPFCKWQKEEGLDTLEVHLQGFKKDQLRVQLNNLRVMRISGERPVDQSNKRTGFQKEITVSENVKTNEIRAKFSNGILYITMPKQTPQTPSPPKTQENEQKKPEMGPEAVPKKTENTELAGKEDGLIKKKADNGMNLQMNRKMAVCVIGTFALLVVIGVFLMYFKPSKFRN